MIKTFKWMLSAAITTVLVCIVFTQLPVSTKNWLFNMLCDFLSSFLNVGDVDF